MDATDRSTIHHDPDFVSRRRRNVEEAVDQVATAFALGSASARAGVLVQFITAAAERLAAEASATAREDPAHWIHDMVRAAHKALTTEAERLEYWADDRPIPSLQDLIGDEFTQRRQRVALHSELLNALGLGGLAFEYMFADSNHRPWLAEQAVLYIGKTFRLQNLDGYQRDYVRRCIGERVDRAPLHRGWQPPIGASVFEYDDGYDDEFDD